MTELLFLQLTLPSVNNLHMTHKLHFCFPLNFVMDRGVFCSIFVHIIYDKCTSFSFSGNILNFNVGDLVDLDIPRSFWSRLAGKYGNMFYWKEKVKLSVQFISQFFFVIKFCLLDGNFSQNLRRRATRRILYFNTSSHSKASVWE